MLSLMMSQVIADDKEALVLPAGDAFQNPYWPQGLGVNRGILSGLDAVWAAHLLAMLRILRILKGTSICGNQS